MINAEKCPQIQQTLLEFRSRKQDWCSWCPHRYWTNMLFVWAITGNWHTAHKRGWGL